MAVAGKTRVIRVAIILALFALVGIYEVWMQLGVRTRPWHLEAYLESSLAECRTGPGAYALRREYAFLEIRVDEAKRYLLEEDRTFWLWRNYDDATGRLVSACLDAQLLRLKLTLRQQEQRAKLSAFLAPLKSELGVNNHNGKIWSRFELSHIEQTRAKSLVEQADSLERKGEIESALNHALRAWAAWRRFNDDSDQEFARYEDQNLRGRWDRDAAALLSWSSETGRRAILVDKLAHKCLLVNRGKLEKSYPANLGRNWYRQKVQERDASTPEGHYRIRRMFPSGKYGYALLLDYPNGADRERFDGLKRRGEISPTARIGGGVEIHGGGRHDSDWTEGCVSLEASDMRDLYRRSSVGMRVTIVGTSQLTSSLQGQ
jgi:L,D-transpeptidase catalytic domain